MDAHRPVDGLVRQFGEKESEHLPGHGGPIVCHAVLQIVEAIRNKAESEDGSFIMGHSPH
ncbi:MAG: hypothetical protein OXB95_01895 [Rhodobacteraceae bacterium]|nr:hypothetical protein [Paracoccaceae bacterium]